MRLLSALVATGVGLLAATVPVVAAKGPLIDRTQLHISTRR